MITPTIGRQVWYYAEASLQAHNLSSEPFAATVVHVNDDATVNLVVLDHLGNPNRVTNCTLVQDLDKDQPSKPFCTWMPYQKAQAAAVVSAPVEAVSSATHAAPAAKKVSKS